SWSSPVGGRRKTSHGLGRLGGRGGVLARVLPTAGALQRALGEGDQLLLHEGERGHPEAQLHQAAGEPGEEAAAQEVAHADRGEDHPVRVALHAALDVQRLLELGDRALGLVPQLLRALVDGLHALAEAAVVGAVPGALVLPVLRRLWHGGLRTWAPGGYQRRE